MIQKEQLWNFHEAFVVVVVHVNVNVSGIEDEEDHQVSAIELLLKKNTEEIPVGRKNNNDRYLLPKNRFC